MEKPRFGGAFHFRKQFKPTNSIVDGPALFSEQSSAIGQL
jgi:hypothetical protein